MRSSSLVLPNQFRTTQEQRLTHAFDQRDRTGIEQHDDDSKYADTAREIPAGRSHRHCLLVI
jgi:hypothetical protein